MKEMGKNMYGCGRNILKIWPHENVLCKCSSPEKEELESFLRRSKEVKKGNNGKEKSEEVCEL